MSKYSTTVLKSSYLREKMIVDSQVTTQYIRRLSSSDGDNNKNDDIKPKIDTSNELDDLKLQLSFQDPFNRLIKSNFFLSKEILEEYNRLISLNVLSTNPTYGSILNRFILFDDLQNPLLKKYNFDPVDFMEGANEAFKQIFTIFNSIELSNFSKGNIQESSKAELIKSVTVPKIHDTVFEALKGAKFVTMLKDFKIVSNFIETISTDIITKENDKSIRYPQGSVVAYVTVNFIVVESYIFKNRDLLSLLPDDDDDKTIDRTVSHMWTFESCISGHKEMDWIICKI
eukprot:gene9379-12637_t